MLYGTFDCSPKATLIQSQALPALYSNPIHKQIKTVISGTAIARKAICRQNQTVPIIREQQFYNSDFLPGIVKLGSVISL